MNFYFYNSYISPQSTEVHGITVEKLYALSGGKTFYDYADEIEEDFSRASLTVAHNFPFDFKFMFAEFANCYKTFKYNEKLDTMRYFNGVTKLLKENGKGYKYPKLSELIAYFDITDYEILNVAKSLFGCSCGYHDARFDTTALYLAMNKGMNCEPMLAKL